MLNIIKAVFGGVMLFLGRDMEWLFSLGISLLVGQKVSESLIQPNSPFWLHLVIYLAIGTIGILPYLIYPESRYSVIGFYFGGYILSEYANSILEVFFSTGLTGSTWIIFFVGAIIGTFILSFIKEWGVMLATSMVGAFLISDLFSDLITSTRVFIASGLFILGGIVQTIIMRIEKASER